MENNQVLNHDGNTLPNIHSEQIKEEFYKWFESRGLLAELRAYMRQLMVKALEENNVNGIKKWQKKTTTSPKLQAINLLVVDYMFHEDFFYTVSVFASEAHILDSLPQYSSYVTQSVQQRRWDPDSLPRFSRQETEDILDTLHLPPTRHQLRQAVDCYLSSRDSLLACIVRTMVPVHIPSSGHGSMEEDPNYCSAAETVGCYQLWSQEIQQLLLMAGLKLSHIQRMQYKWAQTIENERQQTRREMEEEFAGREAEWQRVIEERLQEGQTELRERQSRVEVREQSLANLAEHLTAVHEDVTQRLSQLQLQSGQLDERELQQENERLKLEKKIQELKTREESLDFALNNVHNQNKSDAKESLQSVNESVFENQSDQRNLTTKEAFVQVVSEYIGVTASTQTLLTSTAASTQTLDVAVVGSTQTVDTQDHELQTSLDQPDPQLVSQLDQARRKISELQEENLELRAHILQQRHRIDELTNRAADLSNRLEDSQVAVAVLSGRESGVVASPPTPPPPPPVFIAPTFGFRAPQRQGGGEESLFHPRPQQTSPRADGRRRPLRFAFSQQPSPTSGESSPTDEIIQNARVRIQQLEQESVSIQRHFQNFQTRLFTADSVMFPPLRPPRTSDPVMRVRRNEVSSLPTPRTHQLPLPFDNLNQMIQNRQHYEEQGESSSEFYDTLRIESISNSRRLFHPRNIRHYERWKQYKKKFQKRDGPDYNRRNFKAVNSNTSSEDDDTEVQNLRRQNLKQPRNVNPNFANRQGEELNAGVLETNEVDQEDKAAKPHWIIEKKENVIKIKGREADETPLSKDQSSDLFVKITTPSKEKLATASPSKTESQIQVDLERSEKLIESVKVLLDVQSIKESDTTTLSNGSLAVESLPQDSVNNSPVDIAVTDSSVVTVQKISPSCNPADRNINFVSPNPDSSNKPDPLNDFVFCGTLRVNENQQSDKRTESCDPEKVCSTIPETNLEGEDIASNFAITSSDVAEADSGDRATTSLTSGSDILRELNPSKSDSNSSEISAGLVEDSKHSSDFWD